MNKYLPYAQQSINEADQAAVRQVLESDWLTCGQEVENFEADFAAYVGAPHAVTCANGTAALHLTVLAANLGPYDQMIVPAVTFLATANALRFAGVEVVFADVDPLTGLLTAETLTAALKRCNASRLRGAMVVHLAGRVVPVASLHAILEAFTGHRPLMIEDACHALGGIDETSQLRVGACQASTAATFSFHPAKIMTCGEGGMVCTRDQALATALKQLRSHGMVREPEAFQNPSQAFTTTGVNPWYYEMQALGFNYRLTDLQCALGRSQLRRLDQFVATRQALVAAYDAALQALPQVRPMVRDTVGGAWHLYAVHIDFAACGVSRRDVMLALRERGIGTQVHYIPLYRQPYYATAASTAFPGAETYYQQTLSLPLHVNMQVEDVTTVVEMLGQVLRLG